MENIAKNKFQWVGPDPENREGISRPSTTFFRDAMGRFVKNKVALVCAGIIILMILGSIIIPFFSPFEGREQHYAHVNAGVWTECQVLTDADGNPEIHHHVLEQIHSDVTCSQEFGRAVEFLSSSHLLLFSLTSSSVLSTVVSPVTSEALLITS